jgi:hypothetical protein
VSRPAESRVDCARSLRTQQRARSRRPAGSEFHARRQY